MNILGLNSQTIDDEYCSIVINRLDQFLKSGVGATFKGEGESGQPSEEGFRVGGVGIRLREVIVRDEIGESFPNPGNRFVGYGLHEADDVSFLREVV